MFATLSCAKCATREPIRNSSLTWPLPQIGRNYLFPSGDHKSRPCIEVLGETSSSAGYWRHGHRSPIRTGRSPPSKRRWFQYSISTLLLLMLVCGVVLVLFVNPALRQRLTCAVRGEPGGALTTRSMAARHVSVRPNGSGNGLGLITSSRCPASTWPRRLSTTRACASQRVDGVGSAGPGRHTGWRRGANAHQAAYCVARVVRRKHPGQRRRAEHLGL